ncbi:MAG TPA: PHB depolymerase family esterase [Gemmatimonadales bacterium]|nr:PHB depolymerase family esterase [Gemmatimonadales bacterium]
METLKVEAGGRERLALVARTSGGRRPAVVMLHGAGGTAGIAVNQTGWDRKAAEHSFIAVFPEGTARDPAQPPEFRRNPQTWNDGSGRGHVARAAVDDIAFIAALIGTLTSRYGADPAAILLTGFSNGASLAFRAAAELRDHVAAVAPVAGHCWHVPEPGRLPPLLYLMGDADPLNPIEGGAVQTPWGGEETHPPARQSFERWSLAAGCHSGPAMRQEGPIEWAEAADCTTPIRMGIIAGHGHIWPGGPRLLPQRIVGRGVSGCDATAMIWKFFEGMIGGGSSTSA